MLAQAPVPAALQNYQPVTAERLKNPEPANWLMNRRTYDGWGYSPLNQITPPMSRAFDRSGYFQATISSPMNLHPW